MTRADTRYEVALRVNNRTPLRWARVLASAVLRDEKLARGIAEIVISDRCSGVAVHVIPWGISWEGAQVNLDELQADLQTMSDEEFRNEHLAVG